MCLAAPRVAVHGWGGCVVHEKEKKAETTHQIHPLLRTSHSVRERPPVHVAHHGDLLPSLAWGVGRNGLERQEVRLHLELHGQPELARHAVQGWRRGWGWRG